jgi:hypothetical protein
MIYTQYLTNLMEVNHISLIAKTGVLQSGGYGSLINDKVGRLAYNLVEAGSLAISLASFSSLTNSALLKTHAWRQIIIASIIAAPIVTRAIAYFGSKKPLDNADRLDIFIGQIFSLANIVNSCAVLVILKPNIGTGAFVVGGVMIGLNLLIPKWM